MGKKTINFTVRILQIVVTIYVNGTIFNVIDACHVNNIINNFLINFFTVCLKFKTSIYNTYIVKFVIYLTLLMIT